MAAVASYLDARSNRGEWLVRIEDVDETRAVPGAADTILRTLEAFGFEWDGPVLVQSQRKSHYDKVTERLVAEGFAYPCCCTRSAVRRAALPGLDGFRYPGTCRKGLPAGVTGRSYRIRVDDSIIRFTDRVFGVRQQNLADAFGDFVIRRTDGLTAYQLAVVVDDLDQKITHIVRGADLLPSTLKQLRLYQLLGDSVPRFAHVPLVIGSDGKKLSKSAKADDLCERRPVDQLAAALLALGQRHRGAATPDLLDDFWPWAIAQWEIAKIGTQDIPCHTL